MNTPSPSRGRLGRGWGLVVQQRLLIALQKPHPHPNPPLEGEGIFIVMTTNMKPN